jgi:uncharacterized protein YceK
MRKAGVGFGVAVLLLLSGCGSGGTTTVIKEAAPTTVEKTTTVEEPPKQPASTSSESTAPEPPPEPEPSEPPNVVGLPLPAAEQLLREEGFKPAVRNTDTTFGILVPSHYTICEQDAPRGDLVPVLAQKYGC